MEQHINGEMYRDSFRVKMYGVSYSGFNVWTQIYKLKCMGTHI